MTLIFFSFLVVNEFGAFAKRADIAILGQKVLKNPSILAQFLHALWVLCFECWFVSILSPECKFDNSLTAAMAIIVFVPRLFALVNSLWSWPSVKNISLYFCTQNLQCMQKTVPAESVSLDFLGRIMINAVFALNV